MTCALTQAYLRGPRNTEKEETHLVRGDVTGLPGVG